MSVGLWLTWILARRIVRPVDSLDRPPPKSRAKLRLSRAGQQPRRTRPPGFDVQLDVRVLAAGAAGPDPARAHLHHRPPAGSIVHDLRNPLAAIYGGAEMLVDTDLAPAQVKRLAGNIYRASRRIQEMLQELLDVSRGRTGQAELCKLREVIQAAVDAVRPTAEAQSVRTELDVPGDLELPMERARMERVFVNLIVNSLEAMPAGKHSRRGERR